MVIGNSGSNRLGNVIRGISQRAMESDELALFRWNTFGEIQNDYSLKLYSFSDPYPVGSYFVAHHLLSEEVLLITESETEDIGTTVPETEVGDHGFHGHGTHAHPPHTHQVIRQKIFHKLMPGDRVIVAWANTTDPVVVDRYGVYDPTLP